MKTTKKTCNDCRYCCSKDTVNMIGRCINPNLRERNSKGEPHKTVRLLVGRCKYYEEAPPKARKLIKPKK